MLLTTDVPNVNQFVTVAACMQRPDCVVHDEPLYAHFLRTHPEDETWRPYRDEVFQEQVNEFAS